MKNKLYYSKTSPFVRKVLIAAHETGQIGSIELVSTVLSPTAPSEALSAKNPLGKIPALELADGTVLYDSRVICEYLDSTHSGAPLVPRDGPERFEALRLQALADGIVDGALLARYELLREEPERSLSWARAQAAKAAAGLGVLEREISRFEGRFGLGQIAACAALGWLLFRDPLAQAGVVSDQRAAFPKAFAYYDAMLARRSVAETAPA